MPPKGQYQKKIFFSIGKILESWYLHSQYLLYHGKTDSGNNSRAFQGTEAYDGLKFQKKYLRKDFVKHFFSIKKFFLPRRGSPMKKQEQHQDHEDQKFSKNDKPNWSLQIWTFHKKSLTSWLYSPNWFIFAELVRSPNWYSPNWYVRQSGTFAEVVRSPNWYSPNWYSPNWSPTLQAYRN